MQHSKKLFDTCLYQADEMEKYLREGNPSPCSRHILALCSEKYIFQEGFIAEGKDIYVFSRRWCDFADFCHVQRSASTRNRYYYL